METILEQAASDFQWTIVRPTHLLDGNSKPYMVKNRKIEKGSFQIYRIDVAKFILEELSQNQWVYKYPTLGYES